MLTVRQTIKRENGIPVINWSKGKYTSTVCADEQTCCLSHAFVRWELAQLFASVRSFVRSRRRLTINQSIQLVVIATVDEANRGNHLCWQTTAVITVVVAILHRPQRSSIRCFGSTRGLHWASERWTDVAFWLDVLSFSRPRSEGWPHHGRTFSIYLCPLLLFGWKLGFRRTLDSLYEAIWRYLRVRL